MTPLELLRHHVTGAIERGEGEAIVEQTAATTNKHYQVVVGNVGMVYSGHFIEALREYYGYIGISRDGVGRIGGEPVTLLNPRGEPCREYFPDGWQFD